MTKDEALDLALEALEEPGLLWRSKKAITAIKQARALDKKAENARELGLGYEPDEWMTGCPECGIDSGCDCDSGTWNPPAVPAPVREPVWIQPDHLQKAQKAPFLCRVEPNKRDDFVPLYTIPPAAKRQWVGLTPHERMMCRSYDIDTAIDKTEAELKEKNT